MPKAWLARIIVQGAWETRPDHCFHAAIFSQNESEAVELLKSKLQHAGLPEFLISELATLEAWATARPDEWDVLGLAVGVNAGTRVVFGESFDWDGPEETGWLSVIPPRPIELLTLQQGVFPRRNVPEDIKEDLFTGEAATYAVLDAAKFPMLPEFLENSGLRHCCLFSGNAADKLRNVAPWLVELKEDCKFVRHLFTKSSREIDLGGREAGIFIKSSCNLEDVRAHLRYFTRLQDEEGRWKYFRFWSGAHLFALLRRLPHGQIPEFRQFFMSRHAAISSVSHIDRLGQWEHAVVQCEILKIRKKRILTREFREILQQSRRGDFSVRLSTYLSELDNPNVKSIASMDQFVNAAISGAASHGLKLEKAVVDYAEAWLHLGTPPENHSELSKILKSGQHSLDKARHTLRIAQNIPYSR